MFANSSAETKTTTEKAFVEGFAKQIGDIGAIMIAILSPCSSRSCWWRPTRWRRRCASGRASWRCSRRWVHERDDLTLVLAESMFVALVGGGLGWLAWVFVQGGDPTGGFLPVFFLPRAIWSLGIVLMVAARAARRAAAGVRRCVCGSPMR